MRIVSIGLLGAVALTASVAAQSPAATTIQQDFNAAVALDAAGDKAAALAAWEKLEARTVSGSRSRGIALVRKGAALFALQRSDDAVIAARAGLALLPANDVTLAEDRWRAYFNLGTVASDAIDYASASEAYAQAEQAAGVNPMMKMAALLAFVETATFVDPVAAEAALGRIDAIARTTTFDAKATALIARRHALVLMNRGQFEGARTYGMAAVKALGGLTQKTDLADVAARSDTAIASLLAGKVDDARRYMAMTGAGRLTKGDFDPAVQMKVPDCGGEAGLKSDDVAVIEFTIGDDGAVVNATPVYAAGGGLVALEFARAARDWS